MRTAFHKVLRDFRREISRNALVVLAIAAGVAAFSAVLSSRAILTRSLNEGYLATNPASATLWADRIDDALVRSVLAGHGVAEAEPRRTVSGRIRVGPAQWKNLELFVVKDDGHIRVNRLVPEVGAWPPGPGELFIERDALQVARARVGDTVSVETARGREARLRIAGRVHDVGQAQARMENLVYGYITLPTLERLGEEPYLDQVNIVVAENRFDDAHVRRVAEEVASVVERSGHPVRRLDVPAPGKHPHAAIMGLLLLVMSVFGLFALALSGILVVSLLTALMASQVRQIGVMKAVGATRAQITAVYMSQAVLLGLAAVALALPAGNLGARVLSRAMAVFLNFDITSFAVPASTYALVAAAGLAAPLLAAFLPVWEGTAITIREALGDHGVAGAARGRTIPLIAPGFVRSLDRLGGARLILFAVRNASRRRARLAGTTIALATGGLFFLSALNVRTSFVATLDRLFAARRYDLSLGLGALQPMENVERAVRKTSGVSRAEGWIVSQGEIPGPELAGAAASQAAAGAADRSGSVAPHGRGGKAGNETFTVLAPPAGSSLIAPDMTSGRFLAPGDRDALVVNSALIARWPAARPGETVTFRMGPEPAAWKVVGVAREPFAPPTAYVPMRFFEAHGHVGVANTVRLALPRSNPDFVDRVRADLERNLEREGVRPVFSASKAESRFGFDQHMLMIDVFLVVVSALIGGVGGLGLATTTSLNVLERRRELAVLAVLGATPAAVWTIVAAESVGVGVLAWALAALGAWPVSWAVGNLLTRVLFRSGLESVYEPRGLALWLAVSVVLAVLASAWPAWRASRQPPREGLAFE